MQTDELLERLRRHYIKPGALPGGVFVPEVSVNGAWGAGRRVDALYAGFTQSSGRILIGHELKVSRSDWLHELATPEKGETWASACNAFYLVVPDEGIVSEGELPLGWGLMMPTAKTRTRLQVVVKPPVSQHDPPWWATRSMMARLDTLMHRQITQEVTRRVDAECVRLDKEALVRATDAQVLSSGEKALIDALRAAHLGYFNADEAPVIVEGLRDLRSLKRTEGQVRYRIRELVRNARELTDPFGAAFSNLARELEAINQEPVDQEGRDE